MYLLFLNNLPPQKLFNVERIVFRTAPSKISIWNPNTNKYIFLFKKGETKKEWLQLYLADTRNLTLLQHPYVRMLYGRWIKAEGAKCLRGRGAILFDKIEITVPSGTLGKRTIVLHGNKFYEKIHVDRSFKYAIKGKLTSILGS